MRPRAAGLLATHDGGLTPSILRDHRLATCARQAAHGAAHAGSRHAAPLSAAAHDLLRLWCPWARHHRRDLLDQGEALTLTPAELASVAVWLTLPWTIKMVFGQ